MTDDALEVGPDICPDCGSLWSHTMECAGKRINEAFAFRKDLDEATNLIGAMIGWDKGPDEDHYVEWNEKARPFWLKQRDRQNPPRETT